MGQKDISQKILLSYNDVLADVVNVLLFHGKNVISEEELEDQTARSHYKADEKVREIERDIALFINAKEKETICQIPNHWCIPRKFYIC